jgi:putative membrane protein
MTDAKARFTQNRTLHILLLCYAGVWAFLALRPLDRSDWLLENLLVFVTMAVLVFTYARFPFSNPAYGLISLFLALHAIGAHYTYAKVPLGFWLQNCLHLNRNHFDRVIHFSFGLLLLYPFRELLNRAAGVRQSWSPWLALTVIVGLSSFFEIIEAIVAQLVRPELGNAYLGTQGDIWDAQKDMLAAAIGGSIAAIATHISTKQRH